MTAASSSLSRGTPPFAGPPDPHLVQIRDQVYGVAGIFMPDNKLGSLEEGCVTRMEALSIGSFRDYLGCLKGHPGQPNDMHNLLNEITNGETCFFRNQPQLDALRNVALPRIVQAKADSPLRHVRIWSAGCSTGEEPYTYSIVMLEELAGKLQGWTFEIFATDLNEKYLAHCERGAYSHESTRNLTPHVQGKYFAAQGEALCVNPEVKAHVQFSQVNLLDDAAMPAIRDIDIILCCNVLIYFDAVSKRQVLRHFHDRLLPHGYLFMGHAESLHGVNGGFHLVHLPFSTAYVKDENGESHS